MSVTRKNVEFAKRIGFDRVGNPYVYGGNWDPYNLTTGTDCSGLCVDELDAAVNGTAMAWTRHGLSTESWRLIDVGEVGPFGTICVARPGDFPTDAAVKLAIHHGPGGGANSHMWCEVDGVRFESNGTAGCITGDQARSVYDTSYANDWHYLPGPIIEDGTPRTEPTVTDTLYGPDVSNNNFNSSADAVGFVSALPGEGFSWVEQKVSEGSSYKDPYWPAIRDWCTANDFPCIGYHYVRVGDPAGQAANFVANGGGKFAMLDFEANSGDISNFWAVVNAFNAADVEIALSYIPRWYWQQIGSPDLSQVPGLIASNYVNGSGYASVLYPGNDDARWAPYGGATPQILQFTSSALVAGKSVDANAFKGTITELRALLGYATGDNVTAPTPVGPADDQLTLRWNQLGGQTVVEAIAQIRDKVCGTNDAGKTGAL